MAENGVRFVQDVVVFGRYREAWTELHRGALRGMDLEATRQTPRLTEAIARLTTWREAIEGLCRGVLCKIQFIIGQGSNCSRSNSKSMFS